jgi:hypothetical protein
MKALVKTLVAVLLTVLTWNLASSKESRAGWEILPDSRHHLYQTYGLYFEEQSSLVYTGNHHMWGAVGGAIPIAGDAEGEHHPQFVFHSTANAAMHFSDSGRIYTETIDARLGLQFEYALDPQLRFAASYTHFSAHAADGIEDLDLLEPPVGEEFLNLRAVYDIGTMFRVGLNFNPVLRSYPKLQFFGADQFIEYFPLGSLDSPHKPSPYVAAGLSEWGVSQQQLTFHAQIGVAFANHFGTHDGSPGGGHSQAGRAVLGYYTGADPRLKYFQYREATKSFGYLGVMFDL